MSINLFFLFIKLHIKSRMEYRGDFLLGVLGQIIAYAANFLVVWLLLQRFDAIGGWTWEEVALLYSLNLLCYSIGAAFTFSPMVGLDRLINSGDFDCVLIKPTKPFSYLTAKMFNLAYIAHITTALVVLIWSIGKLPISWSVPLCIYFILFIISGGFIHAAALVLIGCWGIVVQRSHFLFMLHLRIRELVSYPITVYSIGIQLFLTLVFPLAFVNYYPVVYLLSKEQGFLPSWIGLVSVILGPIYFLLSYKIWHLCVNKYQSGGG